MNTALNDAKKELEARMVADKQVVIHGFHGRFIMAAVRAFVKEGKWIVAEKKKEGLWASKRKGKGQSYHYDVPKTTYKTA